MDYDHDEVVRRLYERIIRQRRFPGGTCPAEHVMVAYESGMLPSDEGELLEQHLSVCPPCRQDFIDLGRAGQWFRQNESRMLMGLAHKGAARGVLPWSKCLSAQLLYRYVNRQIPQTAGGKVLVAQMQAHLGRCPQCAMLSEMLRSAAAAPRVSILELGAQVGQAIRSRLAEFLDALVAMAEAAGGASVRGAPGYRSAEAPSVSAMVLDEQGKLLVDEQGSPRQCRFEIVQANIQPDGFLTLDLAAVDRQYHRGRDRCFQAAASILAENLRLELPPTTVDAEGRATFTGMLGEARALDTLPPSAIDVVVTAQPAGASGQEDRA